MNSGHSAAVEPPSPRESRAVAPSPRLCQAPRLARCSRKWVAIRTAQGFLISALIFGEKHFQFHLITKFLN